MWKIDIFERKRDGNRGELKTTSKYETKQEACAAQFTLRQLSRNWTQTITVTGVPRKSKPNKVYKMNNVIVADPVEV